jgi:hypothetical protein
MAFRAPNLALGRLPAALWLSLCLSAVAVHARAELAIAASTSFVQSSSIGRFTNLRSPTALADGGMAWLAQVAEDNNAEALIIQRAGQFTIHRAGAFGAAPQPAGRSGFIALTNDGASVVVAVNANSVIPKTQIFTIDARDNVAQAADVTPFMTAIGGSARITEIAARDGVIAISALNLVVRAIPTVGPSRIAMVRAGNLRVIASSNTAEGFTGFSQLAFGPGATLYFVAALATPSPAAGTAPTGLYRWEDETLTTVIPPSTLVNGASLRISSASVGPDGAIALFDASVGRVLLQNNGQLVVLARNNATLPGPILASVLQLDANYVYCAATRTVQLPNGNSTVRDDLIYRLPRQGGPAEIYFEPKSAFPEPNFLRLSTYQVTGATSELTFLALESNHSDQAIFRGTPPFGAARFPAVPAGYPQLSLEDPGTGFSYNGGAVVRLDVANLVPGPTTYVWSVDDIAISATSDLYRGLGTERLSLFPFAQSYHGGIYTVAATNAVGTSYASSLVQISTANHQDGVGTTVPLVNISLRGFTGTGDATLTAGISLLPRLLSIGFNPLPFRTYETDTTQRLLIRAIGPGLAPFLGAPAVPSSTQLSLYNGDTLVARNDGAWSTIPAIAVTSASAGAFPLPVGSRDSALLLDLGQHNYTAQVTAPTGEGIALAEFYVVGGSGNIRNISARAQVSDVEPRTVTIGFVIGSQAGAISHRPILLRAVGPGLRRFAVNGPATRPVVELYSGDTLLTSNGGYRTGPNTADIVKLSAEYGAFELDAEGGDAALLLDLPPGVYTAHVRAAAGGGGVALAELYTNVGF